MSKWRVMNHGDMGQVLNKESFIHHSSQDATERLILMSPVGE